MNTQPLKGNTHQKNLTNGGESFALLRKTRKTEPGPATARIGFLSCTAARIVPFALLKLFG